MNITCSAEKGVMDRQSCLDCALSLQNKCGYDYVLLKSLLADGSDRSGIHVTDITGCLRKAWYDKRQPAPEYIHEKLARWLGISIHAAVEGEDEHLYSEMHLEWNDMVGRSDIFYKDGRIVDIKTSRWIFPAKLPYGSQELQVNIYAKMLREAGYDVNRLQIQHIDLSGPTKCRKCRVPVRMFDGELKCPKCFQFVSGAHLGAVISEVAIWPDEELTKLITERKEKLYLAIDLNSPADKEPGYLCSYCGHADICRPDVTDD